jgi:hypothetical protein
MTLTYNCRQRKFVAGVNSICHRFNGPRLRGRRERIDLPGGLVSSRDANKELISK